MDPRDGDHVGDAQVVEPPLALLEKENALVPRAVVVAHPDRLLVPHERLPEPEARAFGLGLRDEHRFGVAEQIEVGVALQRAERLVEQLGEPRVGKHGEPVVARSLAVLQTRRRADRPMFLERLVRRVGHEQIERLGRLRAQPLDRVQH
jgi:hypothetical protein